MIFEWKELSSYPSFLEKTRVHPYVAEWKTLLQKKGNVKGMIKLENHQSANMNETIESESQDNVYGYLYGYEDKKVKVW